MESPTSLRGSGGGSLRQGSGQGKGEDSASPQHLWKRPSGPPKPEGEDTRDRGEVASTGWLWDDLIRQYRGNHRNQYIKTSNLEVFIFCEYAQISCVHKEKISSFSMVCKKQSSLYIEQYMKLPYSFTHWKLYICNIVWSICLQNIYLHHQSFTE